MKKNDEIEVVIDDIGANGEGIAHFENYTIFVPFTMPNEKCKIHILKVKDNLVWAKAVEIYFQHDARITPKCKYYKKCGGCQLEHVSQEYELQVKAQKIATAFKKNAKIDIGNIEVIASRNRYSYRNKCAFPIRCVDGNAVVCMFKYNSHIPLAINRCELADENINIIIEIFNQFLQKYNISAYSEEINTGLVKFLVVRVVKGVPLITIVINGNDLSNKNDFVKLISANFDKFGINLNINTKNNNVIFSDKFVFVAGEKELYSTEFGITYPISSLSFMQINDDIKSKIYSEVLNKIDENDTIIDAYSGAGLLSAIIAKKAKKVYGIEIIKDATKNANSLAKDNKISNLTNINGDCVVILPTLVHEIGDFKIVLDPPRKGCDEKVLGAIITAGAKDIIYISCNPATLARDAKLLLDAGYKIDSIKGYNMFPNTEHVETLAIFKKEI